jgi:CubicO group peptidase (beta-lactamase class C family)
VVGGTAVLVRDGRIVARHHDGFAVHASGRRVGDSTIYHWASVTKTLTAIAVLQLRDRGLLTLDDPITRWVPELRAIHDPDGAVDRITLRMLLSHSSGFQAPTWPWGHGDPWPVYVQKNIWTPLGMDRSYVGATPYRLATLRSRGYRVAGDSVTDLGADFNPGITIPNSGWNAPAADVARYLAFLPGAVADSTVLARRTLEEMWTPSARTGAELPEFAAVGVGFFSLEHEDRRIIGHTGDQAGHGSYVYFDPAASTGVILAFNTNNDDGAGDTEMAALAQEALSALRR